MNRLSGVFFGMACLCVLAVGQSVAESKMVSGTGHKLHEAVPTCTACADSATKANAKLTELKSVKSTIRSMKAAAGAKEEEEELSEKHEKPGEPEDKEQGKEEEAEHPSTLSHEERLHQFKEKNPEKYALVVKEEQLEDDLKSLRDAFEHCEKMCSDTQTVQK